MDADTDIGNERETVIVAREAPDQPEVAGFLAAADARAESLYPANSRHGLRLAALVAAGARFFVARKGGRAVGCGGYVLLDGAAAEIKRVWVAPSARRLGVARAIMAAIEREALGEAVTALLLETGVQSAEALLLYQQLGFAECTPFAAYQPDPLSVFMRKRLPAPDLLHVMAAAEWERARQAGAVAVPRGGFLHLCTRAQLAFVLARHFAGREGLVVLVVDASGLDVRWEVSEPERPPFPHLFEALPADRVRETFAPAG